MKRASEVPPEVESSGLRPVTSSIALTARSVNAPGFVTNTLEWEYSHTMRAWVRIGDVALHAVDIERAGLRAAAADLDAVAEDLDIRRLAEHAMVELFAVLGAPFQKLDGAVDRNVLFVPGDQKRDRAFAVPLRLAAIVFQIVEHRGDAAGDAALHVDRAATIEKTVLHLAGERAERPCGFVARRHHVGMSGKGDVWRFSPDTGVEVVDI